MIISHWAVDGKLLTHSELRVKDISKLNVAVTLCGLLGEQMWNDDPYNRFLDGDDDLFVLCEVCTLLKLEINEE